MVKKWTSENFLLLNSDKTEITYHSIVISDHFLSNCFFPEQPAACRAWHLKSLLLSDSKFTKFVNTQIKFFTETNLTPDISHGTLWEIFKAFLRGRMFSFTSHSKKENISKSKGTLWQYNSVRCTVCNFTYSRTLSEEDLSSDWVWSSLNC